MKLEEQVISLSLATRLKELGVKQESYFYWIYTDGVLPDGSRDKIVAGSTLGDSHWELGGEQDTYSAFNVAELFELMPMTYASVEQHSNDFRAGWRKRGQGEEFGRADNPTEALGLMLAYLIENKFITT